MGGAAREAAKRVWVRTGVSCGAGERGMKICSNVGTC